MIIISCLSISLSLSFIFHLSYEITILCFYCKLIFNKLINRFKMSEYLWKREEVKNAVRYLKFKIKAPEMSRAKWFRFKSRFANGDYSVLPSGRLVYKNKIIVPLEEKQLRLEQMYKDPKFGNASGERFYNRISNVIGNISKNECKQFVESQRASQMLSKKQIKKPDRDITPILSYTPKKHFQLDLIDLNKSKFQNLNFRYILTLIDHFSKFAFALPLKNRSASGIAAKLDLFFEDQQNIPSMIHGMF